MIRAEPRDCSVHRQVEDVQFGFYSDEETRQRSVVEVTNPMTYDAMGTALPNGLYDPRMGPCKSDSTSPCPTCACLYVNCPGHFGHIELCVPVYHPLLFGQLLTLLRIKCFHCHSLLMDNTTLLLYRLKFQLLTSGKNQYKQMKELDTRLAQAYDKYQQIQMNKLINDNDETSNKKTNRNTTELSARAQKYAQEQAVEEIQSEIQDAIGGGGTTDSCATKMSSYERTMHAALAKEFISSCRVVKACPHCGAHNPKIRHDSFNKIFQSPLSQTLKSVNLSSGIEFQSAMEILAQKEQQESSFLNDNGDNFNATIHGNDSDDDDNDNIIKRNMEQQQQTEEQDENQADAKKDSYLSVSEVHAQLKLSWNDNTDFVLRNVFAQQGLQVFFLQSVPVPPSRFRPPMVLGSMSVEHGQNAYLSKMITLNRTIQEQFATKKDALAYASWMQLQIQVNCFMDSSKDPNAAYGNVNNGIRQLLERKEGMFRKFMMGKRVNHACRSVISPDPYVGTNEIGIPMHFAKTLTFPVPVTDTTISTVKTLVERGPDIYPGARWVQYPDGRRVELSRMNQYQREAVAARLLQYARSKHGTPAIVGRQLQNGDMVLMNRQPTLHKPGIMGHEVRVLHNPEQKTIRMHYANCNTYNADFDGDEMNCHFPQSEVGRAEAKYIAGTDLQYIVPTDGSPLRGLIQDHVVGGVQLTKRDTFLERWQYQQLLFATLASLPGLELIHSHSDIELLPPTILKPKPLWTGKQVISTLLHHLRKGNHRDALQFSGLNTTRKTKTPEAAFSKKKADKDDILGGEHVVLIRDGELLRGVLDKAAFGSTDFSLVHAVHEAYGPTKAGLLLNSLGRLFTAYIQQYSGHSCRMQDLILTDETNEIRRKLVQKAYNVGSRTARAWADSEGGKVPIKTPINNQKPLKPVEAATAASKVRQLLSGNEGKANSAAFDGFMMSQLNPLASDIVKACLPDGLAVPFPENTFGIMCSTGAKGSIVNQSQVSCALGQQALEGRRVPRMSSGRTLPSFVPFDVNPRADGFVMDRFLTGIRPQEYYFHCMAGREGLVDTAVKTSRSGYLQRCLVKHLEELKICYDFTVRNGEGGVVQFLYGEDGLDPTKASYLDCTDTSFEYMARNYDSLKRHYKPLENSSTDLSSSIAERLLNVANNDRTDKKLFKQGDFVQARRLRVGKEWKRGTLCLGWHDATVVKVHSKRGGSRSLLFDIRYQRDGHIEHNVPMQVDFGRRADASRRYEAETTVCELIRPATQDPITSSSIYRPGTSGLCVSERVASAANKSLKTNPALRRALDANQLSQSDFKSLVAAKYTSAICDPGEAVGSIAAQSIGEPSTQMTLNTFHLAGSGANVTLGIPRLREIIMTASRTPKTPTMSVPLHDSITDKAAVRVTRAFKKLTLDELIAGHHGVMVRETLAQAESGVWERRYYVSIKLHPAERIKEAFGLSLSDVAQVVAGQFRQSITYYMKLELRRSATDKGMESSMAISGGQAYKMGADDDEDEDIENGETNARRRKSKKPSAKVKDQDINAMDLFDDEAIEDNDEDIDEEDGVRESREQAFEYDDKELEDDEADGDNNNNNNLIDPSNESDDDNDDDKAADDNSEDEDDNGDKIVDGDNNAHNGNSMRKSKSSNFVETFEHFGGTLNVDKKGNIIHLRALCVDPAARPLLMVGLVELAASKTIVRQKKSIDEAFINDEEGRGRCLQTAGSNFEAFWSLDFVDHSRLMSNDVWAVRCAYGVEAARNNIMEQIRNVFGVYGIEVDPRHLSLIADYMTHGGDYTPMNRNGMKESSSPFLQMSFETTAQFMTAAALQNFHDTLASPSANLVLGRPVRHGTGAFTLLVK